MISSNFGLYHHLIYIMIGRMIYIIISMMRIEILYREGDLDWKSKFWIFSWMPSMGEPRE